MGKYDQILKLLNFEKIGDEFILNNIKDNKIISNLYSTVYRKELYDRLSIILDNDNNLMKQIKVKYSIDRLSINFIYDGGNSEFLVDISNFDYIFLSILRDIKIEQLIK